MLRTSTGSALGTIAAALLFAIPAASQDYARTGIYGGIAWSAGRYIQAEDDLESRLQGLGYVSADVDAKTSMGFSVFGGYRLHPRLALEAEFEMLPQGEYKTNVMSSGSLKELEFEFETWSATGNGKFFLLTGRAQPFLLAGVGVLGGKLKSNPSISALRSSGTGFAMRFGGGVDFYFDEKFGVSIGSDYMLPTGDVSDFDYVSVGAAALFRF